MAPRPPIEPFGEPFVTRPPWWDLKPSSGGGDTGDRPHNPRSWQMMIRSLHHTLPHQLRQADHIRRRMLRAIR